MSLLKSVAGDRYGSRGITQPQYNNRINSDEGILGWDHFHSSLQTQFISLPKVVKGCRRERGPPGQYSQKTIMNHSPLTGTMGVKNVVSAFTDNQYRPSEMAHLHSRHAHASPSSPRPEQPQSTCYIPRLRKLQVFYTCTRPN